MIVLALLGLSALLLLALQRPRRPTEDDPLGCPRASAPPTSAGAHAPAGCALVLLAAVWYFVWNRWSGRGAPSRSSGRSPRSPGSWISSRTTRKPATSVPFFDLHDRRGSSCCSRSALFALHGAGRAGRASGEVVGRPGRRRRAGRPGRPRRRDLDDPRAEPDPRAAIIRAYASLRARAGRRARARARRGRRRRSSCARRWRGFRCRPRPSRG